MTLDKWQQRDLEGIRNPDSWPRWPILPLIRVKGGPKNGDDVGILLYRQGPVVYLTNMIDLDTLPGTTYGEKLKDVRTVKYESFEALVQEWRVD